jgi:hypothetical protein
MAVCNRKGCGEQMSDFMDFLGSRPPREAFLLIIALACAVAAIVGAMQ